MGGAAKGSLPPSPGQESLQGGRPAGHELPEARRPAVLAASVLAASKQAVALRPFVGRCLFTAAGRAASASDPLNRCWTMVGTLCCSLSAK